MDWTLDLCRVELVPEGSIHFTSEQLRGFFGYFFLDDAEFHHHGPNSYYYPMIQYKLVGERAILLGLGAYADILFKRAQEIRSIIVPLGVVDFKRIDLTMEREKINSEKCQYEFVTPWIALNQENYRAFKLAKPEERKKELERILIGNILAFLKAFSIRIDFRLQTKIMNYQPVLVKVHENNFEGFQVVFEANVKLPNLIGLGKSVSKGFGTIKEMHGK